MNKVVLALGVLSMALGGTSYYLWQRVSEDRVQNIASEQTIRDLTEQLKIAALRNRELSSGQRGGVPTTDPASPPPVLVAPAHPQPPAPTSNLPGREQMRASLERQQQMLKDPDYRAAMKTQQKMGLRRQYTDVGAALNLSTDETNRFLDLLAEQQLQSMEQGQSMRLAVDPSNPSAFADWQQQMEMEQRRKEQEIAALLGDTGLQAWKEYQSSLGARAQVRELRALLDGSTSPLRDDQFQPLINSVAAEQKRQNEAMQKEDAPLRVSLAQNAGVRMAFAEQSLERTANNNKRLHEVAAVHLSSEQLARYDELLDQRLEAARANLKMMQMQAESGGNAAPGQIVTSGAAFSFAVGPAQGVIASGQ